jgi:hypothetical protein
MSLDFQAGNGFNGTGFLKAKRVLPLVVRAQKRARGFRVGALVPLLERKFRKPHSRSDGRMRIGSRVPSLRSGERKGR